jgi:heavy metal translocating P-type ATPase
VAPPLRIVLTLLRRYPVVAGTLAVAAVAGALTVGAFAVDWLADIGRVVLAVWVIGVAVRQLWLMVRQFRQGHWGLDVLAVLAIGATVAVGELWAGLVVALMITGGGALEDFAESRARGQVDALLQRTPQRAHLLGTDGEIRDIDVDTVAVGDLLVVKPGELVPVDAVLLDGPREFDESSLTGESLPVERTEGDSVPSGAVNGEAVAQLRATAVAGDSQYQRIVALVAEAASTKARFVRIADRVSIPFTVVSVALAALAWLVSGEPVRAAEVLVAATPCPLLIAAPVAFVAGMGAAAYAGVVIKSGDALEALARARTVAFDKTGTLTRGAPRVDRIESAAGVEEVEVLSIAAGAESLSPHVLARAVVEEARERGIAFAAVHRATESAGAGIRGELDGAVVRVGKAAFAADGAPDPFTELPPGDTAITVARGGAVIGRIVLRDELRPESAGVVAELRRLGVPRILMLTGDVEAAAHHVGAMLGIDELHAELRPGDKLEAVASAVDRPVVMVGDGVNDAPVLAAADVGIAMGARGSTAASESAGVVLLVDDLRRVTVAMALARRTVRIATESIWVGIGLSLALMAVATTGVIPAIVGAVGQEAIDVITILNGLRAARRPRAIQG